MKKILLINPFGIGDVLFTTPVVANLRLAFPNASLGYLANRRGAEVLKDHADIEQIFIYERDEFIQAYRRSPLEFAQKWLRLAQEIREQGFDTVFDFSLNTTFGFLSQFCGIHQRIGYDYRGRGRFLTHKLPLIGFEGKHVIEHHFNLLESAGIAVTQRDMHLAVPSEAQQWARDWLTRSKVERHKLLIALVPGGGASWGASAYARRWPAAKHAQLADKIIENYDAAIILLGDLKEQDLCAEVARCSQFSLYSAAGETSVARMAALMQQCGLTIVNDGGPLHIAVAAGVPTVSMLGPVDPQVYGPYPPQGHAVVQQGLACQPCYRRFRMAACSHISCLRDLSVEQVYRKVKTVL